MFRQLNIVSAQNEKDKYVVTIGGKADFAQNKLDWNSEQVGADLLTASKEEEESYQQTMDDELQKIIDQSGFGK